MLVTGFRCLACGREQDRTFTDYVCPACGANLDVCYDYEVLHEEFLAHQVMLAGRRDIFRYAHLLPVQDLAVCSPLQVGQTPLYRARRLGARHGLENLYLKDDSRNPSASFKDRAGAVALAVARERGVRVIACASTGNAGSSMAGLCASVGQPCVVFVPETAPPAKLTQLRAYGATVIAVRGSYDQAYDLCTKACEAYGWFNRSTGFNPFTREGKKTCSFEIWEQLGEAIPDRIVVSAGDGNILSGIWKGMADLVRTGMTERMPKIDVVQAEGSAAIVETVRRLRAAGETPPAWSTVSIEPVRAHTIADSISVDAPRDGLAAVRAVMETGGEAVTVSDESILGAADELARYAGVFSEPAAAAAWAGVARLADEQIMEPDERIVCLLTGHGLKDPGAFKGILPDLAPIEPSLDHLENIVQNILT